MVATANARPIPSKAVRGQRSARPTVTAPSVNTSKLRPMSQKKMAWGVLLSVSRGGMPS